MSGKYCTNNTPRTFIFICLTEKVYDNKRKNNSSITYNLLFNVTEHKLYLLIQYFFYVKERW